MITCFLKGERRGREKQWKRREVRESWIGEVENNGRAGSALRRDFICLLDIYIKIQEEEKIILSQIHVFLHVFGSLCLLLKSKGHCSLKATARARKGGSRVGPFTDPRGGPAVERMLSGTSYISQPISLHAELPTRLGYFAIWAEVSLLKAFEL